MDKCKLDYNNVNVHHRFAVWGELEILVDASFTTTWCIIESKQPIYLII